MVRIFQILNEKYNDELNGWFAYDTETKRFALRLLEDYTNKHPSLHFMFMHKNGYVNAPEYQADIFVEDRIVPSNRQNIDEILEDIGLEEYDEFGIMLATEGRGQMDYYHISELEQTSDEYKDIIDKLEWGI